jgi:hypothetical protein
MPCTVEHGYVRDEAPWSPTRNRFQVATGNSASSRKFTWGTVPLNIKTDRLDQLVFFGLGPREPFCCPIAESGSRVYVRNRVCSLM